MTRMMGRLLLAALLCSETHANNFNYSNLEIGSTLDLDAVYVAGYFSVADNAHLLGSVSSQFERDWIARVGAGFHAPINNISDILGNLLFYNIKSSSITDDWYGDFAFGIEIGGRIWLNPALELNAMLGRISYAGDKDDNTATAGVRFHSTDNISVGAQYDAIGIFEQKFFINVRFEF